MKAYLLKESLAQLWQQPNEHAARAYLWKWIDQTTALATVDGVPEAGEAAGCPHRRVTGLLHYYKVKVRFGVVEAINGNLQLLLRRDGAIRTSANLLLPGSAQRMAATKTAFIAMNKAA